MLAAIVRVPCCVDLAGGLWGLDPLPLGLPPSWALVLASRPYQTVRWVGEPGEGTGEAREERAERLLAAAARAEASLPPHPWDGQGLGTASARRLALLAAANALTPGPPLPPGALPGLLARWEQARTGLPRSSRSGWCLLLGGLAAVRSGPAGERAESVPFPAGLERWLVLARLPVPAEDPRRAVRALQAPEGTLRAPGGKAASARKEVHRLRAALAEVGAAAREAVLRYRPEEPVGGLARDLASLLAREAELRQRLAGLAPAAARAAEAAREAGALAVRPCGGGGGFLLAVVPPGRRAAVARALQAAGAEVQPLRPAEGMSLRVELGRAVRRK